MARKLTEKQKRFCDEYLIDLNGTRSYKAAYLSVKKDATAAAAATRLLRNVKVAVYISGCMLAREKRTEITQDRVLREYAKIAFFDPRKLFYDDGTPKGISQLDDDTAAALAGLDVIENWEYDDKEGKKVKNGHTKKYKITEKKGALDSLARHLGMFTDKVQITGEINVTSPCEEINRRIASIVKRQGKGEDTQ